MSRFISSSHFTYLWKAMASSVPRIYLLHMAAVQEWRFKIASSASCSHMGSVAIGFWIRNEGSNCQQTVHKAAGRSSQVPRAGPRGL